ncbi:hypothetical protein C2845_PM12G30830 [Panicum miliaceum]|uniref:Uncharacterized protein n=1 Tax=Panicum miliaceum TaxID=4540 RepID=A0A3L6QDJ5_PANMI|nr:hypothetical protein C2845_PM12G30830 [Panicum miliaceum]
MVCDGDRWNGAVLSWGRPRRWQFGPADVDTDVPLQLTGQIRLPSSDNYRAQEHPAEALLSEIRGEAEVKESSSRQSRSGEQQQTAQGSCHRCWKPVKRKKLNHSWWLSSSASLSVMRPIFDMPAEACVLLIADG